MAKRLFTSESVTEGHPDKVCDQISDAVLDDILAHDPTAHVACETFTTTGIVTVMGEITTKHYTDIPSIVRRTVERIGYTDPAYGFDYRSCAVMTAIDEQSPDIAMGVNQSYEHQEGGTDAADLIGAGCAPTARARSPWSTATTARCSPAPPSWCPPSTTPTSP